MEINFNERLIKALQEGILLLVKYGLIIAVIIYTFNYSMNTRNMAQNGEQAALAIKAFQSKGWLPAFQQGLNGTIIIPDKPEEETKKVEENK